MKKRETNKTWETTTEIKEASKSFHLSASLSSLSLAVDIDDVDDVTHITMASIESLIYCIDTVVIWVRTVAIKAPFIRLRNLEAPLLFHLETPETLATPARAATMPLTARWFNNRRQRALHSTAFISKVNFNLIVIEFHGVNWRSIASTASAASAATSVQNQLMRIDYPQHRYV